MEISDDLLVRDVLEFSLDFFPTTR